MNKWQSILLLWSYQKATLMIKCIINAHTTGYEVNFLWKKAYPYENSGYFKSIFFLFYILFYTYLKTTLSLFLIVNLSYFNTILPLF